MNKMKHFQIQEVLQQMKDKFQTMSDQILSKNILFYFFFFLLSFYIKSIKHNTKKNSIKILSQRMKLIIKEISRMEQVLRRIMSEDKAEKNIVLLRELRAIKKSMAHITR